ncbi:hypothetical protein EDD37DRAFT_427703 [Exophiala viscosa]|uniref:uncharacterized protein n=1 Tax=Exophiala viscosa TaxID=2486360 RepID=UPI002196E83C|nr:hypothetical protein EDD37DRAFT_427703 [Exophiala viscosa]
MTEAQPKRQRRRPAVSCTLCRRRKQRCNRELPCNNCVRANREDCVYEDYPPLRTSTEPCVSEDPPLQPQPQSSKSSFVNTSTFYEDDSNISIRSPVASGPYSFTTLPGSSNSRTPGSEPSAASIAITTVQNGRAGLSRVPGTLSVVNEDYETGPATSGAAELCHRKDQDDFFGRPQIRGRLVIHKSRLFGQSHWMNGCDSFRDIFDLFESYLRTNPSNVLMKMETCKTLGRSIKSNSVPAWPTTPTMDLPPKELADKLLDCYLNTYETVYRVLHVPTFRKAYEALWMPGVRPDMSFLVQVKLVLALGVEAADGDTSLRDSAVRWVCEGQTWFSAPAFKSHLTLQSLQTKTLLLLAREKSSVGADLVWISAGSLLRTAVYMGLHRDPEDLPKKSLFATEMRRRVWNTILEVALQSSMTSGAPPLISLDDFNTRMPGNFDDEQLMSTDTGPKPDHTFTQVSVARALRKTFPIRLAVVKYLNDLHTHSRYEAMLPLDEELRAAYKGVCRALQQASKQPGGPGFQFAFRMVDLLMLRYISSLHIPWYENSIKDKTFEFSRRTLIDTLLKIWYSLFQPSSALLGLANSGENSADPDCLQRLVVGRGCIFQAAIIVAAEARAQLQEQESLTTVRPDLLAIIFDTKKMCLESIKDGETNIKGYLFSSMICTLLKMIMRGVNEEDHAALLVKAAEEAMDTVLPILEEKAAQARSQDEADPLDPFSLITPADFGEEWDFMMPDAQFGLDDLGPMSGMFNDGSMQQPW